MACHEATCHAIWLRNFISALEVVHSISRLLKLFCDNPAVVSFSRNTRSTSRSKHIDVKFFFVKEKVVESLISVEHTPTTSMLADPLTKDLPICVFQEEWIPFLPDKRKPRHEIRYGQKAQNSQSLKEDDKDLT